MFLHELACCNCCVNAKFTFLDQTLSNYCCRLPCNSAGLNDPNLCSLEATLLDIDDLLQALLHLILQPLKLILH